MPVSPEASLGVSGMATPLFKEDMRRDFMRPREALRPGDEVLPEGASLLLDVLRFSLAVLVVVGHISEPPFSHGWPDAIGWANGAVPGFFVLSGFMIRYVTVTREREARRYWISRASRIYSVVLPAMVLTVVCDAVSRRVNLPFYALVTRPEAWTEVPARLGLHLLFLGQVWGHTTLLLSNRPFWSMGYEVPYYVLFGLMQFLRGWVRWVAVLVAAVVFGPQILFLLPLWWSGCWLFDLWQWSRHARRRRWAEAALGAFAAVAMVALMLPVRGHSALSRGTDLTNPLQWLHQPVGRATMFEYAAGVLFFCICLLLLVASDSVMLPRDTAWARGIRQIAEGTFTLYLFHFPLLVLLGATGVLHGERVVDRWMAVVAISVLCIAVAAPIDRLKRRMRQELDRQLAGTG